MMQPNVRCLIQARAKWMTARLRYRRYPIWVAIRRPGVRRIGRFKFISAEIAFLQKSAEINTVITVLFQTMAPASTSPADQKFEQS